MSSVTFRDGTTFTDDSNPNTGMKNGGHRLRFIPALSYTVAVALEAREWANKINGTVYDGEYSAKEYAHGALLETGGSAKSWAVKTGSPVVGSDYSSKDYSIGNVPTGSSKAWAVGGSLPIGFRSAREYAVEALAYRDSALNAPGTTATSNTPVTIPTVFPSEVTLTVQPGKLFVIGQFVLVAFITDPGKYFIGQVKSYNSASGSITVNVRADSDVSGTGSYSNWTVSLTVLANLAGAATLTANNVFSGVNTFTNASPIVTSKIGVSTSRQHFIPDVNSDTFVLLNTPQTLTNKTIVNSNITGGDISVSSITTDFSVSSAYLTGDVVLDVDGLHFDNDSGVFTFDRLTDTHQIKVNSNVVFSVSSSHVKSSVDATESDDLVRFNQLRNASVESIVSEQGPLSGFRNLLINGNFNLDRTASGAPFSNSNSFSSAITTAQRSMFNTWLIFNKSSGSGSTLTERQVTHLYENRNVRMLDLQVTSVLGSGYTGTDKFELIQDIEQVNVLHLQNKKTVLSFLFRTTVAGRYPVSIRKQGISVDTSEANSYVSTFDAPANTVIKVEIPIAEMLFPTGVASTINSCGLTISIAGVNQGTLNTASKNQWLVGKHFVSTTDSVNWLSIANARISVGEVQFEEGSRSTPFERRHYGIEQALANRYIAYMVNPSLFGLVTGATSLARVKCQLPVPMRASPLVDVQSDLYFFDAANVATLGTADSLITVNYSTPQCIEFDCNLSSGSLVVGRTAVAYKNTTNSIVVVSSHMRETV